MRMFISNKIYVLRALQAAFIWLIVGFAYSNGSFLWLDNRLEDNRARALSRDASGSVVLVDIDAKSLDERQVWPWKRSVYADLLDALARAGVSEVAFDINFSQASDPLEDKAFADAIDRFDGFVALGSVVQLKHDRYNNLVPTYSPPLDSLLSSGWPALLNVLPDTSGIVRSVVTSFEADGELILSMPHVLGGGSVPEEGAWSPDFSILPETIARYSFVDVLAGEVPEFRLKGRKVVVGATALELADRINTPTRVALAGPLFQALAMDSVVQGRIIQKPPSLHILLGLGVFTVILLLAACVFRSLALLSFVLVISIGFEVASLHVFDLWALAIPSAAFHSIVFLFFGVAVVRYIYERQQVERYFRAERVLSSRVLEHCLDGVLVLDEEQKIVRINPSAIDLLQLVEGKTLAGKDLSDVLQPHTMQLFSAVIDKLDEKGSTHVESHDLLVPFGEDKHFRVQLIGLKQDMGYDMKAGETMLIFRMEKYDALKTLAETLKNKSEDKRSNNVA